MIAIRQEIGDYKSINVKETGVLYSETYNYMFGDEVLYNHYYYKNVIDNNKGNIPDDNNNTKWLKWRISNRYAQTDLRAKTYTIWNEDTAIDFNDVGLISEFENGLYTVLAFGGVHGASIKVEVISNNDGSILYEDVQISYNRPNSNNWYNYYFEEFNHEDEQNFIFNIPPFANSYIRTTIEKNSLLTASVNFMVAGNGIYLGDTLYGLSLGLNDNSDVQKDDFGITTIKKRDASQYMDLDVTIPSIRLQEMKRKTYSLYGEIILIVADEREDSKYESLPILGYIEDYSTVLSNSVEIQASYSIKEVI